jgi:2-polyprenyl-6-methoxyphenol hydroxylase-like FAD-dependent oxidoreductase
VAFVGIARSAGAALAPGVPVATVGAGLRFWAGPMRDDRVYWYATVRDSDGIGPDADEARRRLLDLFGSWHAPIGDLLASTGSDEIVRAPVVDRAPVDRWGEGRVTLLGDAVHPCTPDLGQGACQALESAVVLAESLASDADAVQALRRYEARRIRRTARVTQLSWVTAMQSAVDQPIACAVRDLGVRTLLGRVARPELAWLLAATGRA